ncbi:MAG: hypothetical protein QGH37_14585 [Candidatus Poribacteria bacterium]|nr:hypothetical protein [Candidatus Poribacteria bacterium]
MIVLACPSISVLHGNLFHYLNSSLMNKFSSLFQHSSTLDMARDPYWGTTSLCPLTSFLYSKHAPTLANQRVSVHVESSFPKKVGKTAVLVRSKGWLVWSSDLYLHVP